MKPTLAALLAVLGILSSQAAAATKPWNILFCFADDGAVMQISANWTAP